MGFELLASIYTSADNEGSDPITRPSGAPAATYVL